MKEIFLKELMISLLLIPSGILCILPMKNHLRWGIAKTVAVFLGLSLLSFPLMTLLDYYTFIRDFNYITTIIRLVFFYIVYRLSLEIHYSRATSIFAYVCALMGLITDYTVGIDALVHPHQPAETFSLFYHILHFLMVTAASLLAAYPFSHCFSRIVDNFEIPKVWNISSLISLIFVIFSLFLIPQNYETLYTNKVFVTFWVSVSLLLILLLVLLTVFYLIVNNLAKAYTLEKRNQLLELQESQYKRLREYIRSTSRIRHDFRQTIHTLKLMAEQNDYDSINHFLDEYIEEYPKNDIVNWCGNPALNAILNYYAQSAAAENIPLHLHILIPDELRITDMDLCGMTGNILENAITACKKVPEEERFIDLSITTVQEQQLCIVATNSFSGNVRIKKGRYLSTSKRGSGIGLDSILSTSRKYDGNARFHHKDKQFYTDVIIPLHVEDLTEEL